LYRHSPQRCIGITLPSDRRFWCHGFLLSEKTLDKDVARRLFEMIYPDNIDKIRTVEPSE
jgi:hypothetical protein